METEPPSSDPAAVAPPATAEVAPRQPPVNNDAAQLSKSLKALSINTAARTSLPPSPAMDSAHRRSSSFRLSSSPSPGRPLPSPLNRSSSSLSVHRAASPALSRRSSIVSLQGGEGAGTPRKTPSRRTSGNLHLSSPAFAPKSPLPPAIEEAPPLTAQKVASDYFAKELEFHKNEELSTQTVVILHDACYGHRFSRPKTSKSTLSMIVERPERIHAGILGISTAYVRFGERHAGGPYAPHPMRGPVQEIPFTIRRTSRAMDITSPIVTNVHGTKWMEELQTMCNSAGEKLALNGKELVRTEEAGQPEKEQLHAGDLYLSSESLNAFQGALGGVCDGVDAIFEAGKGKRTPRNAFVCVRPPGHHCSADYPSGFCWLNNVHVGIEYAAHTHGLTHAAIIDFDLHHGDGSQGIAWERNAMVATMPTKQPKNTPPLKRTKIGYFSLHDINSYPCEYGEVEKVQAASLCIENAHGQTVWNVHLQPWKTEEDFWKLYETRYIELIEKARIFLRTHTQRLRASPHQSQPKAAIFISAGFDASEWESQGMQRHKVNVPTEFYARFTQDIVKMSMEEDLGVEGRVISVLEGGYSDRALTSGVLSHLSGLCNGQTIPIPKKEPTELNGLSHDILMGHPALQEALGETEMKLRYNVEWWHESNLTALETLVYPAPPPAPKKQVRQGPQPNFAASTQSFTAKVVDPTKFIRNSSGNLVPVREYIRPPTPPLPDVDWVTAAHELCKLLVPTDRQTKSYRPDELAEPRVKKEKLPPAEIPVQPSGRQLRDRKAKVPTHSEPPSDDESLRGGSASVSQGDRRRTMPSGFLTAPEDEEALDTTARQRRQSLASEIGSVAGERPSSRASTVSRAAGGVAGGAQSRKTKAPKSSRTDATMKPPPRPISSRASNHSHNNRAPAQDAAGKKDPAADATDAMDQLTSGIKRITLKMPSKEEHDAREATAAAQEKKKPAAAKTTRKAPAPRGTKSGAVAKKAGSKETKAAPTTTEQPDDAMSASYTSASTQSEVQVTSEPQPVAPVPQLIQPGPARALSRQSMEIMAAEIVSSFPPSLASPSELPEGSAPRSILETGAIHVPAVSPRPDTPPPPPPASMPQFIHYNPSEAGFAAATATAGPDATTCQQQTILQWLPPNSEPEATVAPSSPGPQTETGVADVHFERVHPVRQTLTGAQDMPAAASSQAQTQAKREDMQPEIDIWEVPDAPAKP